MRGGLGERRVFRVIIKWLAANEPASLRKNIQHIAEYGRYDDLLSLLGTACEAEALQAVADQLARDLASLERDEEVSLLAKWLPSANASSIKTQRMAKRLARALGMDDSQYRKTLSRLRARIRIIENCLREKDYSFDYGLQPSRALLKYRKAFLRHDGRRYGEFLQRVEKGEAQLNTAALTPYDVAAPLFSRALSPEECQALDVTWRALPDIASDENALAVIDGSGSMYWDASPLPAAVALSLGLYFAQRNQGPFHNHFITFSETPKLVEVKGDDLLTQLRYCASYNEAANTSIQRVFELLLETAVKHRAKPEELPRTLYIISDMEFDACIKDRDITNFQYAKELFELSGYQLPRLVFWNVASRGRQQPVTQNEQGVALISGFTPRLFSLVQSGQLCPYALMMEVLESERYAIIAA